jgi:hypothetical protein
VSFIFIKNKKNGAIVAKVLPKLRIENDNKIKNIWKL